MRFPAADGWVSVTQAFGDAMGPFTNRLMAWIDEEGECPADLAGEDWISFGLKLQTDPGIMGAFERAKDVIAAFTSRRTRSALLAVREAAQVADRSRPPRGRGPGPRTARHSWLLGRRRGRGAAAWAVRAGRREPAPSRPPVSRVGEHTTAVLDAPPARRSVEPVGDVGETAALADIRVLDLTWAVAGPSIGRVLADYGATVVRVESAGRLDLLRGTGPFIDGVIGADRSAQYHNVNAGKLGVTLELHGGRGRGAVPTCGVGRRHVRIVLPGRDGSPRPRVGPAPCA